MATICRHAGECGGCSQQHLPYAEQLVRKAGRLRDLLRASLGPGAPTVLPVDGCETTDGSGPWGFRQKVSFVFGTGPGGRLTIGHYAASSNRVVPVTECPVHSSRGNRIAFALCEALAKAGLPPAGPRLDGVVRHVIVRTTADERQAVVMLVVTRNDKRLRRPIRSVLDGPDAPDGFLVNVHDRPGPYMVGRETLTIGGRGQVRETGLPCAYLISPTAFFQTNVAAAGVLLRHVLAAIGQDAPSCHVLDLYSGSGLFGLPLAQMGHRVTMVEENAQAIRDAGDNLRTNRIPPERVRLICARAEDALVPGRHGGAAIRDVDAVVIDPPRDGCPDAVIAAVFGALRPRVAAYVSCNPEALARELPSIIGAGYEPAPVQPIDMFPHTDHLETVVTLRRVSARPSSSSLFPGHQTR